MGHTNANHLILFFSYEVLLFTLSSWPYLYKQ